MRIVLRLELDVQLLSFRLSCDGFWGHFVPLIPPVKVTDVQISLRVSSFIKDLIVCIAFNWIGGEIKLGSGRFDANVMRMLTLVQKAYKETEFDIESLSATHSHVFASLLCFIGQEFALCYRMVSLEAHRMFNRPNGALRI